MIQRSPATRLSLVLALTLCLLLPGAALAGKNKGKQKKQKNREHAEQLVEDQDRPEEGKSKRKSKDNGLGPGGVPALRDDVDDLQRQVYRLERELDEAKRETREAFGRVADALEDHEDNDEATREILERITAALVDLDDRVVSLEELASDDDEDGLSENLGDCDDANPDVNPMMFEVPDNGIDDDCDFEIDELEGEPGVADGEMPL